jgi:ABC-type transport system involved in multi-copper enzyme maturation permease subunit
MTSAPVTPATRAALAPADRRPGFGNLLISEWTKIRSVRSTIWSLAAFVVVTIGFTALITLLTSVNWTGPRAAQRNATIVADPISFILGAGLGLGQLALCVLGALLMTTEYSTGVIRASLLAVPRRLPMLAAKGVIFSVLVIILGEIVVFGSFFIGAAIMHSHLVISLSEPGFTRAVAGAGLYLTVLSLFALAIGGLIRHTAGAISTVIGAVFVLPILSGLLPGTWGAHINAYLPVQAGQLISHAHQQASDLLSPWQGFGVFCLWTALLLALSAYLLARRDA